MNRRETQYDICGYHLEALHRNTDRLAHILAVYRDSDHHVDHLNSPFLLDLNLELYDLNARIERLIQRFDPSYEGRYTSNP